MLFLQPHPMTRFHPFLIFGLSLFISCFGLQHQEIIGFEARFYLFAKEMLEHGWQWFPTTYSQPYPDYLATFIGLMLISAKLLGGLTKLTAVLPSAIASALLMSMTYQIAALHAKRWGWLSVCFLLLTYEFLRMMRTISLDIYPALFSTITFYLIYNAYLKKLPLPTRWLYILISCSFLFRGPIGLVLTTAVMSTTICILYGYKKALWMGLYAFIILVAGMLVMLSLAYQTGGSSFVIDVLNMQIVGRMQDQRIPLYFYFADSLMNYAISFPLACMVMIYSIFNKNKSPRHQLLFLLTLWVVIILVGMSIPADKKTRYVLVIAPALALLAAYPLAMWAKPLWRYLLSAITLAVVIINIIWVEPKFLALESAKEFVQSVEKKRLAYNVPLIFYKLRSDGTPIKYIIYVNTLDMPYFVNDEHQLKRYPHALVIAEPEAVKELSLPYRIVRHGKIGHVPVVVLHLAN